jgi:hypothetical protein
MLLTVRRVGMAAAVVLALMLAACSSTTSPSTSSTAASTTTQASTTTTPPKLSTLLLRIDQMPTGWSVYKSALGGLFGCATYVLEPKGIKQTAKANVAFKHGDVPTVDEVLATFTSAETGYKKIDAKLTACKRFSGKLGGTEVAGAVAPMRFPHYGNTSAAFAMKFTLSGSTFHEDLLIVRKASIVMGIDETDLPSVSASQFRSLVQKALTKLP